MNKVQKSGLRNGQGWIQTWGGVTILLVLPAIASICFFPEIQSWVRSIITDSQPWPSITVHEIEATTRFPVTKQQRLPQAIFKIAEVSEAEPDFSHTGPVPASELSRAVLRLHQALDARPGLKARDIFDAVNRRQFAADPAPCPFEWIGDEGSVVLSNKADGRISLVKTLHQCAAAVEQVTLRGR